MQYAEWEWPEMLEQEILRWPSSWYRPSISPSTLSILMGRGIEDPDENGFPLSFQNVEITYKMHDEYRIRSMDFGLCGATDKYLYRQTPEIVMCGTNETGNSVCARIQGFRPYFRVGSCYGLSYEEIGDIQRQWKSEACHTPMRSNDPCDKPSDRYSESKEKLEHVVHVRMQYYLSMSTENRERFRVAMMHTYLAKEICHSIRQWMDLLPDSPSSTYQRCNTIFQSTLNTSLDYFTRLREFGQYVRCPHCTAIDALKIPYQTDLGETQLSPIEVLLYRPNIPNVSFSHDNEETEDKEVREHGGTYYVNVHCVICKTILSFAEHIRSSMTKIESVLLTKDGTTLRPDRYLLKEEEDISTLVQFFSDVCTAFFDTVEKSILGPIEEFNENCSFTSFEEWEGFQEGRQQFVSKVEVEDSQHTKFIDYTTDTLHSLRVELYRPGDCSELLTAIQYAGLLLDVRIDTGGVEVNFARDDQGRWKETVRENKERFWFLQTYESDVPFVLRFSIDRNIKGMGWVNISSYRWEPIPVNHRDRLSKCQIEVVVRNPEHVNGDNEREEMAPLRCLGFDCEMAATNMQRFVNAKNTGDALTQISCMVYEQGHMDDPIELCLFCLGGCEPLLRKAQRVESITEEEKRWYGRTRIYSFSTEREMLLAFRRFFEINSFDLVYGYNSVAFDMVWLLERSNNVAALGAGMPLLFGKLGKMVERRIGVDDNTYRWTNLASMGVESFRSNQAGTREYKCVRIPMVRQFDIMIAVMSNRKFRSYGLNAVGKQLAKKEKIELDHVGITQHAISPIDVHRSVVSRYCMWDTLLTMEVGVQRESYDVVYSEMARVTGVTMKELLTRGQTIKTYTQLIGFLKRIREDEERQSFIIPYVRHCPIDVNPSTFDNAWMVEGENDDLEDIYGIFEKLFYEGGYVFEPQRGFYTAIIFCLDYKSLYPNIIISFNLCYTTHIHGIEEAKRKGLKMAWDFRKPQDGGQGPIPSGRGEPEGDFYVFPGEHCFVKAHVREGIFPRMLKDTLAARAKMRGFQKNYDYGTPEWLRYNAAQLAFKVTANSAYGFTGAKKLAARHIAATVTFIGRTLIQQADRMSIAYGEKHKGFENDNIYGDTVRSFLFLMVLIYLYI